MEIAEVLSPRRKLACLTLDFETDYGARLGKTFNILQEKRALAELEELFVRLGAPVSAFIRTDLLVECPASRDLVGRLAVDFHGHSHTHAVADFHSAMEIGRCQEVFTETFGRPALGYRAPLGLLHEGDLELLAEHGFAFSSSVFPVFFPGRYGNQRMPQDPFVWENGLLELPLAAVRRIRLTAALSFVKLLGLGSHRLLYALFGLPEIVIFNTHLHDFIVAEESFAALPPRLRLAWGVRKEAGPRYCAAIVELLRRKGYEWVTMTEIYDHVSTLRRDAAARTAAA